MKKCVFAGTFDPFTAGHADTVEKCLALFDEAIVAVAENRRKACLFAARERAAMIAVYANEPRVHVVIWDGAIVDLLQRENTPFYVRGIRSAADLEYENADFYASRDLYEGLIELYIPSERDLTYVSSTLVKNCIAFGKPFRNYVPKAVFEYIERKMNHV